MFHRNRDRATDIVAPPRVSNVRLLETEEELQAAVERAWAFEYARAYQGRVRALTYEQYLGQRPEDLAEVVAIESSGALGA
jgi:hypothetical protein